MRIRRNAMIGFINPPFVQSGHLIEINETDETVVMRMGRTTAEFFIVEFVEIFEKKLRMVYTPECSTASRFC
jgi:hypothetical protein